MKKKLNLLKIIPPLVNLIWVIIWVVLLIAIGEHPTAFENTGQFVIAMIIALFAFRWEITR